ncbi:MAG TPA: S9 family peptidase [Candidatus Acidoferrum sp.]|nr:S9 family peptidase [Candidatus Acidoferrum sp.]
MRLCLRKTALAVVCLGAMCVTVPTLAQQSGGSKRSVEARLAATSKPALPTAAEAVINTLALTHRFEQTAISPDGKKVAWVEDVITKRGVSTGDSAIFVQELESAAKPKRISASPNDAIHAEGSVAWSPDSKKIAFLSDAAKTGQLQLYVMEVGGVPGSARKMTQVKGFLAAPGWSPDGKTIAVLFTENATRASGPLVAETPETGVIKDSFFEQRLALIDAASGSLHQITPADIYIYEYDWAPDSRHFAVTAAPGNGDDNWFIAELYTLDADSGLMKSIYKPAVQIANPAWSADGQKIAFIGGLMSDEASVGGDIYAIPATGGDATNLTPVVKASASWLAWSPSGKILFGEYLDGDSALASLDPTSGQIAELYRESGQITAGAWGINLSLSRDAKNSAVIRSSYGAPPEVWAGATGKWTQITQLNKNLKPGWGDAKSVHWKNGGFEVQGWLLYPRPFDANKKYPLVVQVHGGPGAAVLSEWPSSLDYTAPLAASGYFVLRPNPRGSFGQGEAFTRANVKDFGYGDFKDIMAGVDEAIKVAPIDPERLGICGWSYGGYMTMWAVTQTHRFRAAMAGAGLSNWQSYYGENLIDQWMIPYFGKSVYDDPEVYAKSSPINFIKNAKTPTLLLVGDSDGEVPAPQSYEFWHALKTLGVETELVVYQHEGHMFSNPKHRRDVVERTLAWFDAHMK